MNKELMIACGFTEEVKRYENKQCAWCGVKVYPSTFRDIASLQEYKISGMCQICQDDTFGVSDESDL